MQYVLDQNEYDEFIRNRGAHAKLIQLQSDILEACRIGNNYLPCIADVKKVDRNSVTITHSDGYWCDKCPLMYTSGNQSFTTCFMGYELNISK